MKIFPRTALAIMLLTSCLSATQTMANPSANIWQPSGPPRLHQQPEHCTLSRSFALGGQTILLQFRSNFSLATYETTLASLTALKKARSGKVEISLIGSDLSGSFDAQAGRIPDRDERLLHWYSREFYLPRMVSDDQVFRISQRNMTFDLHWTGAGEAFRQLAQCQDTELVASGIDVAPLRASHTPPEPSNNPGRWATDLDYPAAARRSRKEGEVGFLLTVGTDGKVSDCRLVRKSGHQELDEHTCPLIKQRAEFSPARDANGDAVIGYYLNRVWWKLPN